MNQDEGLNMLRKMKTEVQNKQRPTAQGAKATSKISNFIPKAVKDTLGGVSGKQWVDLTLFIGGIYCMYHFGSAISDQIDNMMPNEEAMVRMMNEQMMARQMTSMGGAGGRMM